MSDYAIKVNTHTVHAVDSFDLEGLVNATYGHADWSFVANEECGNDSQHEFNTEREPLDYQLKDLESFKNGDPWACQWNTALILRDLAEQGKLPHGNILVRVCW